jgi:NADH:ubiquinone reductase (non-electrogenic)
MSERKRVVILGSGFAAFMLLKRIDLHSYQVVVVSPRNHFLFTPLLPSTTVGTVEFRSIAEPIRKARTGHEFIQGSCTAIDVEKRRLTCWSAESTEFTLEYQILVLAVGAWNNTFGIPGVKEHTHFLKELNEARTIREQIVSCLERADVPGIDPEERKRLLHFVVVGGGPTGVEFAAELHDLLEEDLARSYPSLKGQVKITLVEAAKSLLNSFDEELREYTADHFARQGIEIRLGTPVEAVEENCLRLKGGEEMRAGLIVWSTGNAPTKLIGSLPFEKDRAGRLLTNDHLQIPSHPEIFAMGDCANVAGANMPQTAQLAMQEGKYLARALNREARGKKVDPFAFNNLGMLAYVGDSRALADIPKARLHWRGLLTYFFWRSAYLTRLVSLKNKILVLFDWIKTAIFGRDLSKF